MISSFAIIINQNTPFSASPSSYIILSKDWKQKTKQDLVYEINEKLLGYSDDSKIGCLINENNSLYILFPVIQKSLLSRYSKQLELKTLPLIPASNEIKNKILAEKKERTIRSANNAIIDSFINNFKLYNISKLRIYLLILTLLVITFEALFIKKIIKN